MMHICIRRLNELNGPEELKRIYLGISSKSIMISQHHLNTHILVSIQQDTDSILPLFTSTVPDHSQNSRVLIYTLA